MSARDASPSKQRSEDQAGLQLSPIVAGTWRLHQWGLNDTELQRWVEQALDLGVTSFDHADIYGDYSVEARFGQVLARTPALRHRMQLISKCGIKLMSAQRPAHRLKSYDSSAAHVQASVEQSLRALHTDHLDALLLHRPDLLTHPDELAETLLGLRRAGKVLHFGVSNHLPSQLALLHKRLPLATHQIEFSPLQMQALADGTLDQCMDLGLRPMLWSPLGGGSLFTSAADQARRVRAVLYELAQVYAVAPATIAFAWLLRHPSRPLPVAGSGRIQALQEAVAALPIRLSAEDWYRIWEASMGQPVP